MKRGILLLFVMGLLLIACESQPTANSDAPPQVVTVEVTRIETESVQVTQFATVQVPVEVTREIFVEVTPEMTPVIDADVGSAENPLKLIFAPIYGEQVAATRAQNLATALTDASEYTFEAVLPATHQEAVDAVCANADSAIAFLTALEYTLAAQRCDVQVRFAGIRNGIAWQSAMLLVPSESDVDTLEEAAGLSWGVRDASELTAGLYYEALFATEGIDTGAVTEYETDTNTLLALGGEVEMVSADYLPPILPFEERQWVFGEDDPEIWRSAGLPFRSGIGFIVVSDYVDRGGYHVRDARASVFDVVSNIFFTTEILHVGDPIPNDAIGYGAGMPLGIAQALDGVLSDFVDSEACVESLCSSDFFNWEGIEPVRDESYEPVWFIRDSLALEEAEIFEYLNR